jgi:DNA repair protein RecO (recombination protein O)
MPTYTADSLVLHRLNLGENDRILTLYTREHGKLSAVAKGSRRATSRLVGATELFTQSRLLLATGKSLDIVTQCEIRASFPGLRNDLERLGRATYLCELLNVFSHERDAGASAECFDLTVAALTLLQRDMHYFDGLVHAYELRLLSILGYAPVLDHCVACGNPLERAPYGFSPALGGTLCNADRNRGDDAIPLSRDALELLQILADAATETLPTLHPNPRTAAEVDRALRWFIRFRAERNLKSADFLDSLRITSQP